MPFRQVPPGSPDLLFAQVQIVEPPFACRCKAPVMLDRGRRSWQVSFSILRYPRIAPSDDPNHGREPLSEQQPCKR